MLELAGGAIVVREVERPGKQRRFMQASFTMESSAVFKATAAGEPLAQHDYPADIKREVVVLDLREPSTTARLADEVKKLWDEGLTRKEISKRVGLHPTGVTKALRYWHVDRGLTPPKRSAQPRRPKGQRLAEQLADQIKSLLDLGLSYEETAARLKTSLTTITASVKHWHEQRGLPVPDGRTRRRELRLQGAGTTSPLADTSTSQHSAELTPGLL